MANTLNNTINKIGDAVEAILSGGKNKGFEKNTQINSQGQTCLERFGMEARSTQLLRNEWRKDLQYTKPLVDAEYLIQTEFKVSSYEDRMREKEEQAALSQAEKEAKKAYKQAEKKAKKAAKDAKKAEKTKVKEERKESKETLYRDAYTSAQAENAVNFMRNQKISLG